jgi:hypothetical protein
MDSEAFDEYQEADETFYSEFNLSRGWVLGQYLPAEHEQRDRQYYLIAVRSYIKQMKMVIIMQSFKII